MYNGTFEEGDDEESYEGESDDEEESGLFTLCVILMHVNDDCLDEDEDEDLSEGDVSADPIEGKVRLIER